MSQHDFNIGNQLFPATRTDLNNALVALASNSSGASAPATTYANQFWYETDTNKLKIRNEANSAWIEIATLDQSGGSVQSITTAGLTLGSTAISATGAEINQLDAITRGSILYGNASGATARLAKGAAATVLTSDGTDISWAAAGGGGSLVFIATSGAISSGTSTVSFANQFDASKYHHYKFMLKNIKPNSNYVVLTMQTSSDGGSNYLTSSGDYQGNGATQYAGMKISHYYIGQDHGASGEYNLYQPLDSGNRTMATGTGVLGYTSDNWYNFSNLNQNTYAREAATADNAVRFIFSSGAFASGEIQLYGIAKS